MACYLDENFLILGSGWDECAPGDEARIMNTGNDYTEHIGWIDSEGRVVDDFGNVLYANTEQAYQTLTKPKPGFCYIDDNFVLFGHRWNECVPGDDVRVQPGQDYPEHIGWIDPEGRVVDDFGNVLYANTEQAHRALEPKPSATTWAWPFKPMQVVAVSAVVIGAAYLLHRGKRK